MKAVKSAKNSLAKTREKICSFSSNIPTSAILKALVGSGLLSGILSAIVAIIIPTVSFFWSEATKETKAEMNQVSTHSDFGEIVEKYNKEINNISNTIYKRRGGIYTKITPQSKCIDIIPLLQREVAKEKDITNIEDISGSDIFYSKKMQDFRKVHIFYETLGILIKYKAIDFDLVFGLIFFPGKLREEKTESGQYLENSPLIQINDCLAIIWHGTRLESGERLSNFKSDEALGKINSNNKLTDFGSHIKQLRYNYYYARLKLEEDKEDIVKDVEKLQCKPFINNDTILKIQEQPSWNKIYPNERHIGMVFHDQKKKFFSYGRHIPSIGKPLFSWTKAC